MSRTQDVSQSPPMVYHILAGYPGDKKESISCKEERFDLDVGICGPSDTAGLQLLSAPANMLQHQE